MATGRTLLMDMNSVERSMSEENNLCRWVMVK